MIPVFHCDSPDFVVRSTLDGEKFEVNRERLVEGSQVFRDMFSCCDSGYVMHDLDEDTKTLDLTENSSNLNILFNFLHYPPPSHADISPKPPKKDFTRIESKFPEDTIPFPLLPPLLRMADKYAFTEDLTKCLHSHLASYLSLFPLRVYGYAVELGLEDLAAKTSMYLLDPPLSTYTAEDIKVIPSAEAYHSLVLLHEFRIKKLKETMMNEAIFPHGYGRCSKHANQATALWEQQKELVAAKIEAATDVAAEMEKVNGVMVNCETCSKALTAAVSMLAVRPLSYVFNAPWFQHLTTSNSTNVRRYQGQ